MATVQIRVEIRREGPAVAARLIDPAENVRPIELGRVPTKLMDLYPQLFEAWKGYVKAAARAVIEHVAEGIPGATVAGFAEVGPGEQVIKPEERN